MAGLSLCICLLFIASENELNLTKSPDFLWDRFSCCLAVNGFAKGKVQKKKIEKKNLTSVSFAFTHTYTAVKTNSFRFFPQAYMDNFEKYAKTGNMGTLGGGWRC